MWEYLKCQSILEASLCFIGKQILYFRVQTGSLDRLQTIINPFLLPIHLFCKSLPLLFKHLLIDQLVNLLPSNFPSISLLFLFILYRGNNSYLINDINIIFPNATTCSYGLSWFPYWLWR